MAFKDLTDIVAREYGLPASRAYDLILRYHGLLEEALVTDGKVGMPHIGMLTIKHRRAREAVNPRTGLRTEIPERARVAFRAATDLTRRMNSKNERDVD